MPKDVTPASFSVTSSESRGPVPHQLSAEAAPVHVEAAMPAQRAPKNCRECLGALAHRLAQTATALRGGIELGLLTEHSVKEYQDILEQSMELADQMVQQIVALRDLAESNAPAGPARPVALGPLVNEILGEMQEGADSRNLRFQLSASGSVQLCTDPDRLREALQTLLAWVILNASGGGSLRVDIAIDGPDAQVSLTLPRPDLQYLQIQALGDIATPGVLFSRAAQSGTMGWAINRGLVEGLGGKLEIVDYAGAEGCVRARFPLSPSPEVKS